MANTEKDFQWLSSATRMVLGCQDVEEARDAVLKILEWPGYEIDKQALERFNQQSIPYYTTKNAE